MSEVNAMKHPVTALLIGVVSAYSGLYSASVCAAPPVRTEDVRAAMCALIKDVESNGLADWRDSMRAVVVNTGNAFDGVCRAIRDAAVGADTIEALEYCMLEASDIAGNSFSFEVFQSNAWENHDQQILDIVREPSNDIGDNAAFDAIIQCGLLPVLLEFTGNYFQP